MDWTSVAISFVLLLLALGVLCRYLRKVASGDLTGPLPIGPPIRRSERPFLFWFNALFGIGVIGFFVWFFAGLLWSHLRDGWVN